MDPSDWRPSDLSLRDRYPSNREGAGPVESWARLEAKSPSTVGELRARFDPPTDRARRCAWLAAGAAAGLMAGCLIGGGG